MKHTRQVNALEARKWMVANPGRECRANNFGGHPSRWNPTTALFEWQDSLGEWSHDCTFSTTYTITEEIEEPKCEECEELKQRRDRALKRAHVAEQRCRDYEKQLAELKAEKRKGYEWKNCADHQAQGDDDVLLRDRNGYLAIGRFFWHWRIKAGTAWLDLAIPENWEYLEMEE